MMLIMINDQTCFCVETNTKFIWEGVRYKSKSGEELEQITLTAEHIFSGDQVTIAKGKDATKAFDAIKSQSGF